MTARPHLPLLLAAILLLTSVATAAETGRALLERAVRHYADLEAYTATMAVDFVMPPDMAGGDIPTLSYSVAAARGDRVAFRGGSDMYEESFVQSADQRYLTFGILRQYMLQDAAPLAEILTAEGETGLPIPGGLEFLALNRLSGEPGSLLDATEIVDAGEERVDGAPCRRLDLSDGETTQTLWIETGDTPWVARWRTEPGATEFVEEVGMEVGMPGVDLVFRGWDPDPDTSRVFAIEVDGSLKRRDTLPTAADYSMALGDAPDPEHVLVGKPAPPITLEALDGPGLDLAALKGRVVVLDFWATWCQPCLMALPGVMTVTSELAERGVVLWAVNQREKPATIRKLLKEKGWDLPVALDPRGEAGQAYSLAGIPFTVVIDREGVIRHVHRGYAPGQDAQLRRELLALLEEG